MSTSYKVFLEFRESIRRIISFIYAVMVWVNKNANYIPTLQDTETERILTPTEQYIEKRKKRFMESFENAEVNWNANVDAVFADEKALAEIMKDPQNELEKVWRKRVLIENTPRGNVFMFYDVYKRGFSYYCDQAVMPYDIMNAVAMKYVLTFFCRGFFVDSGILPAPLKSNMEENLEEDKKKPNVVKMDKQAFAKFKTYNTATKKVEEKEKVINCFMHLGASRNWSPIMKTVKPNPINGFQTNMVPCNRNLSYLEYKKMKGVE
jgi:hypothetical protein